MPNQDADSGVRDAAAEGFAQLAKGLQELHDGTLGGGLINPVVKMLVECMAEQKVPQQGAAAVALGMVSCSSEQASVVVSRWSDTTAYCVK